MPRLSVIIPVKNGGATLERCLQSVFDQTIAGGIEIIILDSMSDDNSVAIAQKFNARIIDIPGGTFDHGLTRNAGVQHASGELIYLTVQDAWISRNDMLEKMAGYFDDAKVMAVSGHQAVPHELDKNPFVWYRPYAQPQVEEKIIKNKGTYERLSQSERQALISWDNVVAMYRRSALTELPFVATDFTEDWIWSFQALLKGWKLLHDPSLVVYHYHHHSYCYAFNITYTSNYHFYKFFQFIPKLPPLMMPIGRAAYHLLRNRHLSLREKCYWIRHNATGRLAQFFSTLDFRLRLKTRREKGIEKGYQKYCEAIPMGRQRK